MSRQASKLMSVVREMEEVNRTVSAINAVSDRMKDWISRLCTIAVRLQRGTGKSDKRKAREIKKKVELARKNKQKGNK